MSHQPPILPSLSQLLFLQPTGFIECVQTSSYPALGDTVLINTAFLTTRRTQSQGQIGQKTNSSLIQWECKDWKRGTEEEPGSFPMMESDSGHVVRKNCGGWRVVEWSLRPGHVGVIQVNTYKDGHY